MKVREWAKDAAQTFVLAWVLGSMLVGTEVLVKDAVAFFSPAAPPERFEADPMPPL